MGCYLIIKYTNIGWEEMNDLVSQCLGLFDTNTETALPTLTAEMTEQQPILVLLFWLLFMNDSLSSL